MSMTPSVVVDDATTTRAAIDGFLTGYCGATRRSYATERILPFSSIHRPNRGEPRALR